MISLIGYGVIAAALVLLALVWVWPRVKALVPAGKATDAIESASDWAAYLACRAALSAAREYFRVRGDASGVEQCTALVNRCVDWLRETTVAPQEGGQ